jgi:plasmid stability protein
MVTTAAKDDLVSLHIRKVPRTLRLRLRAYCARHSVDMQDLVNDVLFDFLLENDRVNRRAST